MAWENKETISIRSKRKLAREMMEEVFHKSSRYFTPEENLFKDTIFEQITVCEDMFIPIPMSKIEEWVKSKDIGKVRAEAHRIKFAS